jgi:hypothetical protein
MHGPGEPVVTVETCGGYHLFVCWGGCGGRDTGCVSVGALVQRVGEVLGRAHSLFGDPPASGGVAAADAGSGLAAAGDVVRGGQVRMSGLSGVLPVNYGGFATDAGAALDGAAGTDNNLSGQLQDAAGADRSGRSSSGAVVNGAATDTSSLAPLSGTPAGQRALVAALRARVAQQQQVLNAYTTRDARLAATVRSLLYSRRGGSGGGMPMGGMPLGGGGFGSGGGGGGSPLSALGGAGGGLASLVGKFNPNPSTPARAGALATPAGMAGTPLGALTPDSSPREVAAAIIHEARRRGYSPGQTVAIVSAGMQESNLNPRAASPNRAVENIFQQDSSYPGRHNPNLAIAEFFDRLDRHGGPSSPDIWKSIFWLQQRPGDPSASAAYTHGRQAYLRELQSQQPRAEQVYREIAGSA